MTVYISTKNVVAGEQDGYIEFVVQLSAASTEEVTVEFDTRNGSADLGSGRDLEDVYGKLVFAPGVTTKTIRVAINDDSIVEKFEAFTLFLSNPTNAVIAQQGAFGIVVDNDTRADTTNRAVLSVRDLVVDAGAGVANFTVVLDRGTRDSFSVDWSTAAGSALPGADFTAAAGTLDFAAGETVKTVSIALAAIGGPEQAEFFDLVLGAVRGNAASAVTIGDGSGQALIGRNGQTAVATPSVSVNNLVVGEKDGYADFVVSLSAPAMEAVTVYYDTRTGSATLGSDGDSDAIDIGGKLVFAPGVTTQTLRVPLNDDTTVEKLESFFIRLTSAENAVIANPMGSVLIVDNDTIADAARPASLSVRDVVVDAGADIATFSVVLDKAVAGSFSVAYATAAGNAAAGSDFLDRAGTLTFAAGETAKTVSVALPHGNAAEQAELFKLVLGALSGNAAGSVQVADGIAQALIGAHGQAPVATPVLGVSSPFAGEKDGYVDFVVTLSAPVQENVTVHFDITGISADQHVDFLDDGGTLVFTPGVTTQTVRIMIADDSSAEKLETFEMRLYGASNATIANPIGTATIVDNDTLGDTAQRAGLSVRDVVVDATADTATFAVVLDKALTEGLSVAWSTAGAGASAGSDFLADSGTLSFAPGETVRNVTIALPRGGGAEAAETFSLVLGAVSGAGAAKAVVADGVGQATIGAHGQAALAKPAVQVSSPTVSEKAGFMEFVVSLDAPGKDPVTVHYETRDGTGKQSLDYGDVGGTLVFAPGVTTQTVRVTIPDDGAVEGTETLIFKVYGATNASLPAIDAVGTIIDGSTMVRAASSAGIDTVKYAGAKANYTLVRSGEGFFVLDKSGAKPAELLAGVERIQFADGAVALDIDGIGGQAYRIYQAAFNRTPDAGGLGFWMNAMDKGSSLVEVAAGFMKSPEFIAAYGANPGSRDLVSKIYLNVLHRPAEAAGLDYWSKALDSGAVNAAEVLSLISESAENQAGLLDVIGNGFTYTPYG